MAKSAKDEIEYKIENDAHITQDILIAIVLDDRYHSYSVKARERSGKIQNLSSELFEKLVDKHFDDSSSWFSDYVLRKQLILSDQLDENAFLSLIQRRRVGLIVKMKSMIQLLKLL